MNLWLPLCFVASLVGAWSKIHAQGVSEDCCLDYHRCVPPVLLPLIRGYRRQEVSGSCNLPAVIFFFSKDKMLCANPRDSWVQLVIDALEAGNNTLSRHHWSHFHALPSKCKKGSSRKSKLPLLKFRKPIRSNKRETSLLTTPNAGP